MSKLQARNELRINAPVSRVWAVITDINLLTRINPGVINATGKMNVQGATRVCEMNNNGRKGTMTEKLVEMVPEKKTVWVIESDSMGMSKMLRDTRFCFYLEEIDGHTTLIRNESYYEPATFIIRIMNALMMKSKIRQIQGQILENVKRISESK